MNLLTRALTTGAVVLIATASSNAAILITAHNGDVGSFGVSGSDLGQAAGTTLSLDAGTEMFGSAVAKLNDGGIYGFLPADSTADTLTPSDGAVVTFHFDLTASPLGYDLNSIVSLSGSSQGRSQQVYDVGYSVVGGGGFTPLASVLGSLTGNEAAGETQITLNNLGLHDVADLRFTFHDGSGGESMYREIDIAGTPVPEPSSSFLTAGMLAVGGLAAVLLRRKRA